MNSTQQHTGLAHQIFITAIRCLHNNRV